jgi:para-nitrobenzyl esterase
MQNINETFGTPDNTVSENCLFLNVQEPAERTTNLPVLVWFHGGAFTGGQGADYDGSTLAADHKMIFVSVNYRLGVFGFLATTALSATSPSKTSGDYGIEDQQAALRWVHENIAAFGGNPSKVTIAGQSAGSDSVCIHTISPQSRGLFRGGIEESGSCGFAELPTLKTAESQGNAFAAGLGCPGKTSATAACLRAKPAEQLLAAGGGGSTGGATALPLGPVVDGRIVPEQPSALIQSGRFNRVPVIIGSNADEATTTTDLQIQAQGHPFTAGEYPGIVHSLATNLGIKNPAGILAAYPISNYSSPSQAVAAVRTDPTACEINQSAKAYSLHVPTYAYEFSFRNGPPPPPGSNAPFSFGAGHGLELQYIFQHQPIPLTSHNPVSLNAAQQAVSDSITGYWAKFVATGRPDSGGGPMWPLYHAKAYERIVFADSGTAVSSDFVTEHHCALWITKGAAGAAGHTLG